ncbi:MAG: GAF domain-containing protein [Xanthomonadales bacterium]|nr:GAF domain-containing protein [Xanthomonadales bacterium]
MNSRVEQYQGLATQAKGLLAATDDPVANAANLAALIFNMLEQVNWAGFYFLRDGRLLVGPFQGQPACVEISLTTGVCGAAASSGKTQRVADVHEFPGHIACDVNSRSELVVPLYEGGSLIGVLDLDSPVINRFDQADQQGLETLAEIYLEASDFSYFNK